MLGTVGLGQKPRNTTGARSRSGGSARPWPRLQPGTGYAVGAHASAPVGGASDPLAGSRRSARTWPEGRPGRRSFLHLLTGCSSSADSHRTLGLSACSVTRGRPPSQSACVPKCLDAKEKPSPQLKTTHYDDSGFCKLSELRTPMWSPNCD